MASFSSKQIGTTHLIILNFSLAKENECLIFFRLAFIGFFVRFVLDRTSYTFPCVNYYNTCKTEKWIKIFGNNLTIKPSEN